MQARPGDGVPEGALPIDAGDGEDTFVKVVIPKSEPFVTVGLQICILVALKTDQQVLRLKLVEEIDGDRR